MKIFLVSLLISTITCYASWYEGDSFSTIDFVLLVMVSAIFMSKRYE